MSGAFTVIVVDGAAIDAADVSTDSIKYSNLSWEDSVELARLSFMQGFEIIIWKQSRDDDQGEDMGECGTA